MLSNWLIIVFDFDEFSIRVTFIKYLACLSGVSLFLCLGLKIINQNDPNSNNIELLKEFGLYAMGIYVFSEPIKVVVRLLFRIINGNGIMMIIISVVASLFIALFITKYIVKRNRILSLLFLGEKENNNNQNLNQ